MLIRSRDKRVQNYPKTVYKSLFSGVDISGSIGYRDKGSSVLYSIWATDNFIPIGTIGLLYLFYNTG